MAVLAFEQINQIFLKNPPPAIITEMYHWWSPDTDNGGIPLKRKNLTEDKFFFSDNPFDWASPHLHDVCRLFKIEIVLNKPFFSFDQYCDYESIFHDPSPEYSLILEGGFDSILYTPHAYGRGVRQGVVLNAKKNILHVEEIEKPDVSLIKMEKQKEARLWTEILFKAKQHV